jgi:hypothetical protein
MFTVQQVVLILLLFTCLIQVSANETDGQCHYLAAKRGLWTTKMGNVTQVSLITPNLSGWVNFGFADVNDTSIAISAGTYYYYADQAFWTFDGSSYARTTTTTTSLSFAFDGIPAFGVTRVGRTHLHISIIVPTVTLVNQSFIFVNECTTTFNRSVPGDFNWIESYNVLVDDELYNGTFPSSYFRFKTMF